MTRPDNDFYFARAGLTFLPAEGDQATDEQLFSVLDPLRDKMLRLFEAALNKELGHGLATVEPTSVWAVARANTALATARPVADTIYTQPTPQMVKSSEYKYPLLAVYRDGGTEDKFALDVERFNGRWGVDYIMGPLDPADHRRLSAAVHFAEIVIREAIRRGSHPAYDGGAHQFPDQELWRLRIASSQVGPAQFGEAGKGQEFYAVHLELASEELSVTDAAGVASNAAQHEGVSFNAGVGSAQDGILPDVMQVRTPRVRLLGE